jgi:hypothetical protein
MLVHFDATKKTNSYHHVQQSHWPEKINLQSYYYTHNRILLNIENNGPFLPLALLLLNSHKPTKPYYAFDY